MPRFTTAPDVSETDREALAAYSPLLQSLLVARAITSKEDAEEFLCPSYETGKHDPFLLSDMGIAVERILKAIQEKEHIAIYSDYDCDGIPGAVVLHDFFTHIGHEQFSNYIPHRHFEGFGFNPGSLVSLKEKGVTLVITIDCGTTDFEAVVTAATLGIDVIITDHHEPKEELPRAHAIVNPKIGSYPFPHLCGSGVVFKLIEALSIKGKELSLFEFKEGQEKWMLDLVGLATIADMVPLVGENRIFAKYGLTVLRKTRRPGLVHLLRAQKASLPHLSEDDIGFTIAPRINAASRMDAPEDAFLMLSTKDEAEASSYVAHLEKLNNERRGIVASMTKDAHRRLSQKESIPKVLVLGDPLWRPSLAGLLANKLAEEYGRPAFVWGRDGRGLIKGSCRSEGASSVVTLMDAIPHIFFEYGGHHMSGGFGVHEEHIHLFGNYLNDACEALGSGAQFEEATLVDAELSLEDVHKELIQALTALAPFGMGNPKPLFLFKDIVPESVEVFGKTKEHTKLTFNTTGLAKEAIAFFTLPDSFTTKAVAGEKLSLYGHVEQSYFMGRLQTRIRIVDIV